MMSRVDPDSATELGDGASLALPFTLVLQVKLASGVRPAFVSTVRHDA